MEARADARIESSRRGGDAGSQQLPAETDQKAYDKLQAQLREMEARGDAPAGVGALRRSSSRGALLPWAADASHGMVQTATGVHQRL
jgi:hypothetical protein